jgi:5-methylcytosine-specific restriction endonuclease McrA
VKAGDMVDHIVPMREGGDPWDPVNHETLCNTHHQVKRARERHAA